MTTRQEQLRDALADGDKPEDLICFWQDSHGEDYSWSDKPAPPIQRGAFTDLPTREFDYGGTEGEPCIAFSSRHVYICWQYDGAEGMVAIPRNPEDVTSIPWPGG